MGPNTAGNLFSKALDKHRPDIITLSEATLGPVLDAVIEKLGVNYMVFPSSRSWPGVLFTKYEILEAESYSLNRSYWSRRLFTRHWGRALLETDLGSVAIHSLHLFPDSHSETLKLEVLEVLRVLKEDMNLGCSTIVQGDLNHGPEDYFYKLWMNAGLVDAFVKTGVTEDRTFRADDPRLRLDHILAHGPVSEEMVRCRVLNEPPFDFNKIDDEECALSDHLPVMATFDRPCAP
jgi:endonuclease/exonuclease/phosphatase family metal-dependent hydrolase